MEIIAAVMPCVVILILCVCLFQHGLEQRRQNKERSRQLHEGIAWLKSLPLEEGERIAKQINDSLGRKP